ncbi:hypothetical protein BCR44DRAFT_1218000 [Catenaria anguillulae PL171]|uniref:Uncharacterized protein n=1 Tax=Catenaria anguillulae PL171 TaxID=765915 RepID=A0A1Y2HZ88_9FUNG|nr:hypothetical protein BCR44DRAFT_1218000 [Catenaria anguillulae PL171]
MSEAQSEDETASITSERSVEDEDHGAGASSTYAKPGLGSPKKRRETPHGNAANAAEPSETDLNRTLHITLTESETITLLDIPSTTVAPDDSELATVELANEKYTEVLASRASSNNLTHRAIQTYNAPTKTKDIQAVLVKGVAAEVQVNEWSIFDDWSAREPVEVATDANLASFAKGSVSTEAIPSLSSGGVSGTTATMGNMLESSSFISTTLSTMDASQSVVGGAGADGSSIFGNPSGPQGNSEMVVPAYLEKEVTLQSISQTRLKESLRVMESAVLESVYAPRLLEYRDFSSPLMPAVTNGIGGVHLDATPTTAAEAFEANIPSLQYLWSFRCDLVRDRCVMAMAWNKSNPDVLAVGYGPSRNAPLPGTASGNSSSGSQSASTLPPGLICCWSLKNPEYPQRVFRTSSCVTAIDFRAHRPTCWPSGSWTGALRCTMCATTQTIRRQHLPPPVRAGPGRVPLG